MNIEDIVSTEYITVDPTDTLSTLVGTFDDSTIRGVIVYGDRYEGVITRRQLSRTHHKPNQKLRSLVWSVPRVAPDEDVRKVAQLMLDSDAHLLPVFKGAPLIGVVTIDDILEAVLPFLHAARVEDVYTSQLITVDPEDTFGDALNRFREQRITHLPVMSDSNLVGILSLYDVTDLAVRSVAKSQGGDSGGTDSSGGTLAQSMGRTRRGGFGAREGELARMLDLPVRDLMSAPVRTISPSATLEQAVQEMFDIQGSSLVVSEDGDTVGILTKTDILKALTWEAGGDRAVQIYGIEFLDDISYDRVVAMIDKFDDRDHEMNVLDARIHLHEHDETLRGRSLILARIRLHTDRGLYMASGEGYGAKHAINEARAKLERRIRDKKPRHRSKNHRSEEFWEKRFGWLLE